MGRISKRTIIIVVCIAVLAPIVFNVGLVFTDYIYVNYGFTLSPNGVGNKEWLEFYQNYIIGAAALISAL